MKIVTMALKCLGHENIIDRIFKEEENDDAVAEKFEARFLHFCTVEGVHYSGIKTVTELAAESEGFAPKMVRKNFFPVLARKYYLLAISSMGLSIDHSRQQEAVIKARNTALLVTFLFSESDAKFVAEISNSKLYALLHLIYRFGEASTRYETVFKLFLERLESSDYFDLILNFLVEHFPFENIKLLPLNCLLFEGSKFQKFESFLSALEERILPLESKNLEHFKVGTTSIAKIIANNLPNSKSNALILTLMAKFDNQLIFSSPVNCSQWSKYVSKCDDKIVINALFTQAFTAELNLEDSEFIIAYGKMFAAFQDLKDSIPSQKKIFVDGCIAEYQSYSVALSTFSTLQRLANRNESQEGRFS